MEPDGSVNEQQTAETRRTLREERLKLRVQVIEKDEFDGVKRIFQISEADARLIGVQRGDLIEIRGSACAPVRGWTELNGAPGVIALGASGSALTGVSADEFVEIRSVPSMPFLGSN